jgi:uncharacterized protein (UPF0335 family)
MRMQPVGSLRPEQKPPPDLVVAKLHPVRRKGRLRDGSTLMSAMTMRAVSDGNGGMKHIPTPFVPTIVKGKKKKGVPPDPIQTNDGSAAEQLRLFIERFERLHEEKRGISDDIRDVESEAKGQGYDIKALRAVLALRRSEKNDRDEFEAILETYRDALGLR